jgi:hypothetical protein
MWCQRASHARAGLVRRGASPFRCLRACVEDSQNEALAASRDNTNWRYIAVLLIAARRASSPPDWVTIQQGVYGQIRRTETDPAEGADVFVFVNMPQLGVPAGTAAGKDISSFAGNYEIELPAGPFAICVGYIPMSCAWIRIDAGELTHAEYELSTDRWYTP